MNAKTTAIFGACFGLLSVVFGAFGAHALKGVFDEYSFSIYHTAVDYQTYHGLAFILLAAIRFQNVSEHAETWFRRSSVFLLFGVLVFCGSLYLLSFSGIKWLGAITPIGGVSLIIAWALFVLGLTKFEQE